MKALTVGTRESAIMKYLRQVVSKGKPGATRKEIYDAVCAQLGDTVTLPAYYKVLNRMEKAEKIEVVPTPTEGDALVYRPTQRLSVENAITLDDFYDLLPFADSTTEVLAAIERAQLYYRQKQETTLQEAAIALLQEDAREVFYGMLVYWIDVFQHDLETYRYEDTRVSDGSRWAPFADSQLFKRLNQAYTVLDRVAYRALSVPREVLDLPSPLHFPRQNSQGKAVRCDYGKLRDILNLRVFGDTFLRVVDVSASRGTTARMRLSVSGSDASMHAGTIALRTASAFFEQEGNVITFNNSAACLVRKASKDGTARGQEIQLTHSAPFTRQTIDDANYKGMVLAPSMYRDLSESEYEHMARCATDVVQFRIDSEVLLGKARDVNTKADWPTPRVHFRDGTITPQEREFGHYNRLDAYGSMVREGIKLERNILDRIIASPNPPIFAGAVKSTQQHVFGYVLDWYIAHGSKRRPNSNGMAIDPTWDAALAERASDTAVMTYLFTSLEQREVRNGKYYVSCAILRQFPSLTEFSSRAMGNQTWKQFFEGRRQDDLARHETYSEMLHYHASPDAPADLDDDDFVFMCNRADFVSFYVGHTGGVPTPSIPRYEFLASLRDKGVSDAEQQVGRIVEEIVMALDESSFTYDNDHNFMSSKTLVKIVPAVVYRAHEMCKHLGKKLEGELRSMVVRQLAQDKQFQHPGAEVVMRPVAIKKYLERFLAAQQSQPRDNDLR